MKIIFALLITIIIAFIVIFVQIIATSTPTLKVTTGDIFEKSLRVRNDFLPKNGALVAVISQKNLIDILQSNNLNFDISTLTITYLSKFLCEMTPFSMSDESIGLLIGLESAWDFIDFMKIVNLKNWPRKLYSSSSKFLKEQWIDWIKAQRSMYLNILGKLYKDNNIKNFQYQNLVGNPEEPIQMNNIVTLKKGATLKQVKILGILTNSQKCTDQLKDLGGVGVVGRDLIYRDSSSRCNAIFNLEGDTRRVFEERIFNFRNLNAKSLQSHFLKLGVKVPIYSWELYSNTFANFECLSRAVSINFEN